MLFQYLVSIYCSVSSQLKVSLHELFSMNPCIDPDNQLTLSVPQFSFSVRIMFAPVVLRGLNVSLHYLFLPFILVAILTFHIEVAAVLRTQHISNFLQIKQTVFSKLVNTWNSSNENKICQFYSGKRNSQILTFLIHSHYHNRSIVIFYRCTNTCRKLCIHKL